VPSLVLCSSKPTSERRARERNRVTERPFGLSSCRDMRDKLERELERLASATDRDELVDYGLNAAVYASMADKLAPCSTELDG
jgi:hypothetical protein